MKYFIHEPQPQGTTYFFDTKEDFEVAIGEFDFGKYCDYEFKEKQNDNT